MGLFFNFTLSITLLKCAGKQKLKFYFQQGQLYKTSVMNTILVN
jgi:hypothetical protein